MRFVLLTVLEYFKDVNTCDIQSQKQFLDVQSACLKCLLGTHMGKFILRYLIS
jgi:hypothetical protein